jgi:diguanylate cyclase (GGDEF)-like protein/PAS domain S-box-containing protein
MAPVTLPPDNQADALQFEQTKLLYAGLPNAIAINALLALILVSVQSAVIAPASLWLWLAFIGAILLGRIALAMAWRRAATPVVASIWLRRFRIGTIATGVAWGMGTLLLFPAGNMIYQVSLALVLAGMSAGAITLLAVDRVSMLGFLVPALVPLAVRFALEDGEIALDMGVMVALFLFFIAANAMGVRRSLLDSFRLRIHAQEQEQVLRQSEARLKQAQRSARIGNWELDLVNDRLHWSDEIFRIFEIDPAKFGASYEAFLNAIHPDDRERVNRAYTGSLVTRQPYDIVHRLRFADGRIKFVHERCETQFDAEGKALRSLGTVQDITEQKVAEDTLRESEARYRAVAQTANDAIITADMTGNIVGWNRGAESIFGYSETEAAGRPLTMLMPPRYRDGHLAGMERMRTGGAAHIIGKGAVELEGLRKDGSEVPLEISLARWESANKTYFTGIIRDITRRKEAEAALKESESRFRFMLENSPIAARIVDAETRQVVFANQRYADLLNSTPDRVIGVKPEHYYAHPQDYAGVLERVTRGERITNLLLELLIPADGHTVTKWALASYLLLEYQKRPAILGWFYDITDRKEMEEKVQHLAYHDPLTDLPNRTLFSDRLQHAMSIAKRKREQLALMFIDLDKFKPINDTLGHNVGDLLLKEVAQRIHDCLRESDTVGRIGGDEFVVLLPAIREERDAMEVAEKIRQALNRPFDLAGHKGLNISSSTGVAIYPDHGADEKELIKNADDAMYYAKSLGRNNVQLYRPDMPGSGAQENNA